MSFHAIKSAFATLRQSNEDKRHGQQISIGKLGYSFPEVDFRVASIEDIKEKFIENSCVLIRNFADPDKLGEIAAKIREFYAKTNEVHIYEHDFINNGLPSLSSFIFQQKHLDLLRNIFGENGYTVFGGGSCARRVSPPSASETWQKPLGFHLDAGFHGLGFTVNFWTPFSDCGVDAPSLAVVPMSFSEMAKYTDYDGLPARQQDGKWFFGHFRPLILRAASDEDCANLQIAEDFGERLWRPAYNLGDVMMISNYTLHGTHSTPTMTKSREGMELRFIAQNGADIVDVLPGTLPPGLLKLWGDARAASKNMP